MCKGHHGTHSIPNLTVSQNHKGNSDTEILRVLHTMSLTGNYDWRLSILLTQNLISTIIRMKVMMQKINGIDKSVLVFMILCFALPQFSYSESGQLLDKKLHHLRIDGPREWSDFPKKPDATSLILEFETERNLKPWALQLRQVDVKMQWKVNLNNVILGRLSTDANDHIRSFVVPSKTLIKGSNVLIIEQYITKHSKTDDIRVGEIVLHKRSLENLLAEASIQIEVTDALTKRATPCRVTIVCTNGSMPSIGTTSQKHLAIRPGVVYTSTGSAKITLPAGDYLVYAGRGFEYSIDKVAVTAKKGKTAQVKLSIRREVPTEGYVACDTHVHTTTYSKHGDCTIQERMITLAGEGIEFPIATDHNINIDYKSFAQTANVLQYFTPVIGNEVTTKQGHFNVFPVKKKSILPDYHSKSWAETFKKIKKAKEVRAIILNHARDVHSGTQPFGSKLYNEAVGENIKGWKLQANAMEVINSGATQTDALQLLRDWMTQLNRGHFLTPVGCSDSHDVNRYIVGQGRTYIRAEDKKPGQINRKIAIQNFQNGHVMVSFGLLTEMKVNNKYQSGELVTISQEEKEIEVDIRVLGPHWVSASRIQLYVNGELVKEETIKKSNTHNGVKWSGKWTLKTPQHDVHLVAIATGPGIDKAYWRTAKSYQPTSPHFESTLLGCSGAIWIDADHDGKRTSARDYAKRLYSKEGKNLSKQLAKLKNYDAAVAAQVASLYHTSGKSILSNEYKTALSKASPATQKGFRQYLEAWRKTITAQKVK